MIWKTEIRVDANRVNQVSFPPTSVHGGLQTQQQVRQSGLAGSRQVGVQAAALLPQVQFTGFSQRVTDSVVLRDQLLTGGQSVSALWWERGGEKDGSISD